MQKHAAGIDLAANDNIAEMWYVKLSVNRQKIEDKLSSKKLKSWNDRG